MQWEEVETCNFCGGRNSAEYLNSETPSWYGGRPMRLVECLDCHLVFANPRPNLHELYKGYLAGSEQARKLTERKLARPGVHDVHRKLVETAAGYHKGQPERLLDMGCGAGTLIEEASKLGLESWGNDVNFYSIERLRSMGLKALHGFTHEIDLPEDYFDIVTNTDYLEHSYIPFDDLKTCYRSLRSGGVLYLKTLYLDCPNHLINDDGWKLFGAGHFHFFWPRVLFNMIKKAGFQVIDIKSGPLITFIAGK